MDDQTNSVLVEYLDAESKYSYLNYYHQKMLNETDDAVYAYKLDILYEWWWQREGFIPDDYDGNYDHPYDYDYDE